MGVGDFRGCVSKYSAKLRRADTKTNGVFADLSDKTHIALLALVLGELGCLAEWAFFLKCLMRCVEQSSNDATNRRLALVDWLVGVAAYVERVMLIVVDVHRINRVLFTHLENFASLKSYKSIHLMLK